MPDGGGRDQCAVGCDAELPAVVVAAAAAAARRAYSVLQVVYEAQKRVDEHRIESNSSLCAKNRDATAPHG